MEAMKLRIVASAHERDRLRSSEVMLSELAENPGEGPTGNKKSSIGIGGYFRTWNYVSLKSRSHVLYPIPFPQYPL